MIVNMILFEYGATIIFPGKTMTMAHLYCFSRSSHLRSRHSISQGQNGQTRIYEYIQRNHNKTFKKYLKFAIVLTSLQKQIVSKLFTEEGLYYGSFCHVKVIANPFS